MSASWRTADATSSYDHEALLPIPLFLVTAVLCGYLAKEVRRFKRQVRSLKGHSARLWS